MRAICTVCRRENGVRCPHCGHAASQLRADEPSIFICNKKNCTRHTRPFLKDEGGITHRRHATCPPTNQLELLQEEPAENLIDQRETIQRAHDEDTANLIQQIDRKARKS